MSDLKNENLKKAKKRIRSIQSQISGRLLTMAAEVEGLLAELKPKETVQFLHAACDMDVAEARSFLKIADKLKGCEDMLREQRVQYPALKVLASVDQETRDEALARMSQGATLGPRDMLAIRRHFRTGRLSYAQREAKFCAERTISDAKRRATILAADVDKQVGEVISLVDRLQGKLEHADRVRLSEALPEMARMASDRLVETFGPQESSLVDLWQEKMSSSGRRVGLAYVALREIGAGRFGNEHGFAFDNSNESARTRTNFVTCLQGVTSAIPPLTGHVYQSKAILSELPRQKLKVIELCAGAGGMALGLEAAGYEPLAVVEFDKNAAATLRENRPEWKVLQQDVRAIDYSQFRSDKVDLLVAGFPCQPYSVEGKGLGKNDPRDLLLEGARAVAEMKPRAFVFENVVGLLNARHSDHLGNLLKRLRGNGYVVQIIRMEAEDFGIAQERSRILIVGMNQTAMAAFQAPPTFPEWRTNLGDAIGDLMAANGWSGAQAWIDARRETVVVRNGVEMRGALASTVVGRKGGSREKETLRWAGKGIAIANVADAAPTEQEAHRAGEGFLPSLTLRMRARLQGFPDWWTFVGGKDSAARQIGNAVPPVIGQAIGLAVRSALTGKIFDYSRILQPVQQERPRMFVADAPPIAHELQHYGGLAPALSRGNGAYVGHGMPCDAT